MSFEHEHTETMKNEIMSQLLIIVLYCENLQWNITKYFNIFQVANAYNNKNVSNFPVLSMTICRAVLISFTKEYSSFVLRWVVFAIDQNISTVPKHAPIRVFEVGYYNVPIAE